ncbi:MAG: secretin N-terminal domain-containing protein [Thermodesulfobacteriota bacterium]|nr:secretin N-terminal domain-containing protein [Thermodesulfobacteriota bacterium]
MFLNKTEMTTKSTHSGDHFLLFSRLLLLCFLLLSGCVAGQTAVSKGSLALEQQNYDQAVIEFLAAVESNPASHEYRLQLSNARTKAAFEHKEKGDKFVIQQQYQNALQEYRLATELDSSSYTAFDGLKIASNYLQVEKLVKEAQILLRANRQSQARDTVDTALSLLADYQPALQLKEKINRSQYALVDGVELAVTSTQPINLNFRDTKLPNVFAILTRLSGINFILDEDIRSTNTTLFLEQATFAQSLELLLRMNNLDKKILNSKTIILFPKTRDKQKQFEDQIIQTFYLSHIDAKKAVNMLRTMLQVRKIYVQEDLNAIVIRDQPDVIKLAQKLIEANDRGNSEVVFDLELIEVNHSDTREIGLKLSHYSVGAGLSVPGSGNIISSGMLPGTATAGLTESFSGLDPFYSIPTAVFRFKKSLVDAEILANPKIRVRNKRKAKVHVGTREPIVTVTINDTQTSENVQYIEVGVKLDVEPIIQLDNTIVTKLGLEVSNVSGRETTANGTVVITISSTTANTTLTLKDGEQTIIGGLIRNDNAVTKNKTPLLSDIPFIGKLFTGTDTTTIKREILLSITPHIVKLIHLPQKDTASIWSGGEDDLKFGRNFGTFADDYKAGQQGLEPEISPASKQENPDTATDRTPFATDRSKQTIETRQSVTEKTFFVPRGDKSKLAVPPTSEVSTVE